MTAPKHGNLSTTLATWIFLLDGHGHSADEPAVKAACTALRNAEASDTETLSQRLVDAVRDGLGGDDVDFAHVVQWVHRLFGENRITTQFGDDRDQRIQQARSHQFQSNLPWLAAIIDRFPEGEVGPHWVMVERVTDVVHCMDPYPWDDLDEEYAAPLIDFCVKWELAGSTGVRFNP